MKDRHKTQQKLRKKTRQRTYRHWERMHEAARLANVRLCRDFQTFKVAVVWPGFDIPVTHESFEPFGANPFEKCQAQLRAFRAASKMVPDPLALPFRKKNRLSPCMKKILGEPAFIRRT